MTEHRGSRAVIEDQPHWRRDRSDNLELGAILNVYGQRYWVRFFETPPYLRIKALPAEVQLEIHLAWSNLDREAIKVGFMDPPRRGEIRHLPMIPETIRVPIAMVDLIDSRLKSTLH
jgi:hypothetical protein